MNGTHTVAASVVNSSLSLSLSFLYFFLITVQPGIQHWFISETVPTKQWFVLDICDNGHNHTIQTYNLILTVYPAQISSRPSRHHIISILFDVSLFSRDLFCQLRLHGLSGARGAVYPLGQSHPVHRCLPHNVSRPSLNTLLSNTRVSLSVSEQDHDFIGQRYFISVTLDSATAFPDASYTLRTWVDYNHSDSTLFFPSNT
jgi:hypothetical protein